MPYVILEDLLNIALYLPNSVEHRSPSVLVGLIFQELFASRRPKQAAHALELIWLRMHW